MKRRLLIVFFIIGVMGILCLAGMLWQKESNSQYYNHKTERQEKLLYGKRIRGNFTGRRLISGTNLTELARLEAEKQKEEERIKRYIDEYIAGMTLEKKLAQMMILTNEKDITAYNMKRFEPGGVIFFAVDFKGKTMDEVRKRVETLQSYVNCPLLIGVDEEGGEVSRISGLKEKGLPEFKSARALYEYGGIDAVEKETAQKAELLKQMGINLNFDPVADVVSRKGAYMYERSASGDAIQAAEYVETVIVQMKKQDMGCCLKHFPGYGNNVNTHRMYAVDDRALSAYQNKDFIPFQAGIERGADMVMVSHIVMKAVDKEMPASLSAKVHELLRKDLGFSGVVITDDLNMKAILNHMTIKEATAQAFAAGNDMVFSADFGASMQGAKKAVEQGELSKQQINESVARILRMKINRNMITIEEKYEGLSDAGRK